jgi:hypothetical protein
VRRLTILIAASLAIPRVAIADAPQKTAVAIAAMPVSSNEAEQVVQQVRAALARRSDVSLISDADERYWFRSVREKKRRSRANLRAAQKYLKQASASFSSFDLVEAQKNVNKAKSMLVDWVGLKEAVEADRDRLQLAIAIAHAQRDEAHLKEAIAEYAVRFPNEPPPPAGLWPPDLQNRLRSASSESGTVLNVRSEPHGTVYIDGREVGTSPVRLGALPQGQHRAEVFLANFFPTDAWVETIPRKESFLDFKLYPDLSSRLRKLKPDQPVPQDLIETVRTLSKAMGLSTIIVAALSKEGKLMLRKVDLASASQGESVLGDNTPEGANLAVAQVYEPGDRAQASSARGTIPTWAWIGAGTGVAAIGAGVVMRMVSVSTAHELDLKQGALTQAEAFSIRDRAEGQANQGAALLGLGVAAIAGIAGWVAIDVLPGRGS